MTHRIALFGDTFGIPLTLKVIPADLIAVFVGAEIRPQQHAELKRLSETCQIPLLIQPHASSESYPAFIKSIQALNPDLILVNCYSMLVRPEILVIPKLGAVNIHGALLPQYRGCNPIQWALLNNEAETGVTMHYMTAAFDAGDIIAQRRVPIYIHDTWCDVLARIGETTEEMLKEETPKFLAQTHNRQPQDQTKARYYKRRHPEDGIIDWKQHSVFHVYNLVRALVKPYPGAFYYRGSEKVVLDEYLTVPQVTALKYGEAGKQGLNAESLLLIPLSQIDLPIVCQWTKGTHPASFNPNNFDRAVEKANHMWFESIQQCNDVVIFGVCLLKTNQLIGLCRLRAINFPHRKAELQVFLGESSEISLGHGEQAIRLLLRFAFNDLNLNRVYLHVGSTNKAATRVFEKIGFLREGVLREAAHINANYVDVAVMGMLREEFGG